jgi:S-adenosylmethionine synthetase
MKLKENKLVDCIADALLDNYLAIDPKSRVSLKVMLAQNMVIVAGELRTCGSIDAVGIVRSALRRIYESDKAENIAVIPIIHEFAGVINRGIEREDPFSTGADETVSVFGYAANGTENFTPYIPSGFCPSHIQRSGACAARHIAKNLVAAGVSDEVIMQIAYTEGVATPTSLHVNTCGKSKVVLSDGEITQLVYKVFDLRPKAIEERLKLRAPIYTETALQGHFGSQPQRITKTFYSRSEGEKTLEVELFTWEKADYTDKIKVVFGL